MTLASTVYGRVRGERRDGVTVFRGVPYAATPAGAARFAAPAPPEPWTGIRDAVTASAAAPAPPRDRIGDLDMTALSGTPWHAGTAGDYLTVNVWAPEPATGRLPVLVFVHGGGFLAGTGSAAAYDGTELARRGMVVVTVNYRLGAAGWLHLDDAPANRGLLDVLAALRWVRDNITGFGGDPGQVTVAGQSAGATIVAALLSSPLAEGLFHRAISQSGNGLGAFTTAQAKLVTQALARAAGVAPTVDGFAAVSDTDLVAYTASIAGLDLEVDGVRDPLLGMSPFSVVLDPATVPVQPADAVAAGHGHDIDLLIGINADEANLYLVPTGRQDRDPSDMSERLFTTGTEALARSHAAAGGRTFHYRFVWHSDAFDGMLVAAHCVELPFVFGTTGLASLRGSRSLLGSADGVRPTADIIQAAWTGFVTAGDPGWPATTHDNDHVEVLGRGRRAVNPAGWADAGFPLSPAVRVGDVVHVSGQIAVDPASFTPVGRTVTDQIGQIFRNLTEVLHAAGATLDDIVSTRVYLTDPASFAEMNAAYAKLASTPYPARTTVYMPLPGDFLVEIDAVAVLDRQP